MSVRDVARRAIRAGLIAGLVVVYLAAVGMIEEFDAPGGIPRILVNPNVTLGKTLLAIPAFLGAILAVRARLVGGERVAPPRRAALLIGAGVGFLTGGLAITAVAITLPFDPGTVRAIFIRVSPTLINILTFGQSVPVAAVILCLGGATLGLVGAAFSQLPRKIRRPLTAGLLATFSMALFQTVLPQMLDTLHIPRSWLYSPTTGGLTIPGAFLIFGIAVAVTVAWDRRGAEVRSRVRAMPKESRRSLTTMSVLVLLAFLGALPYLIGSNLSQVMGQVGLFVLLGLGLNIVVGYAGLLDLGYVAFFAVGAYATALFTGAHVVTSLGASANPAFSVHLNFYLAIFVVVAIAAGVGLLIGAPVLRLRGDYLAIVTLGFGEIARVLVQSDWLKPLLGGAQGLRDVTNASVAGISFRNPQPFYYLVLVFAAIAWFVSSRLADSRIGRAWNAMREDEQVAEAMGVSTVKYKLLAFAAGAGIGSLSGALFAVKIGSLAPTSFTILVSITVLALIILGGMGSVPGVVVGSLVLLGVPGFLTEFADYQLLLYGAVLVAVMILRPQGLIPNVRRQRELQDEERSQDAWATGELRESVLEDEFGPTRAQEVT